MNWSDEGFLLSKTRYSENSIIAELFTKDKGKISGIIFGGTSKKMKNYLQIGNKLHINYNSKNENRIGYFKIEILKPTKIYTEEILKLTNKNLINAAAHITGGGLIENLLRSVPKNLTLNIDLSKIKTIKIFKWIKTKNISDNEMMKTFNCGIGFCLIVPQKNISRIKKVFSKKFTPYEVGFISKSRNKVNLYNNLKW